MTEFDLLSYIGDVDDRYILESRRRPEKKKPKWPIVLAACAALAVLCGSGVFLMRGRETAAPKQGPVIQAPEAPAVDSSPESNRTYPPTASRHWLKQKPPKLPVMRISRPRARSGRKTRCRRTPLRPEGFCLQHGGPRCWQRIQKAAAIRL